MLVRNALTGVPIQGCGCQRRVGVGLCVVGVNERGTASRPATEQGKLSAAASEGIDSSSVSHGRQYRCKLFVHSIIFIRAPKNKIPRGRAGIEPATSRTRSENHTSRPTARVASIEVRTRDLLLTRQMLCQLSYRGGVIMYRGAKTFPEPFCGALRARD